MKSKSPAIDVLAYVKELARKDFYYYCRIRIPKVYRDDRPHLKELCRTLQDFIESDRYSGLILNMPPRHGKTLTVELLTEWVYGRNQNTGVMVACYNETLASRFSKQVRGDIQEEKGDKNILVYSDIFPNVKIKKGDSAIQMWSLENQHFSFLATSPGGTMTGVGAQLLVIDDLIKNAYESYSERILEEHWDWYNNTVLSRLEIGAKQIVIQTRWSTADLSGRLIEQNNGDWQVVIMQAENEYGEMLCPSMLTKREYEKRKKTTDPVIIAGNYQQEPFDDVDKLYGELQTYDPSTIGPGATTEAYFDTADEGSDYLAGAVYKVNNNTAYILEILYTQDGMEVTEGQSATMIAEHQVTQAWIESNNGGKGFARNVGKILRETIGYANCNIEAFHQGENKVARIVSNATNVKNSVLMPRDWKERWPLFYQHVTKAGRKSKLTHDDFADMLTGIVEKSIIVGNISILDAI